MVRPRGRVRGRARRSRGPGRRRAGAPFRPHHGRARGGRGGGVRPARADVGQGGAGHGVGLRRRAQGVGRTAGPGPGTGRAAPAAPRRGRRPDPGRGVSRRRSRPQSPSRPPSSLPKHPSSAPQSPSPWIRHASLIAAALAFVLYLPSLGGGFLYDDQGLILDNRAIRDLGALPQILRADPSRPLLSLTWALNYAVSGLEPWSYHLV